MITGQRVRSEKGAEETVTCSQGNAAAKSTLWRDLDECFAWSVGVPTRPPLPAETPQINHLCPSTGARPRVRVGETHAGPPPRSSVIFPPDVLTQHAAVYQRQKHAEASSSSALAQSQHCTCSLGPAGIRSESF
ncbi:hypothetical protein AAFF_G00012770 [Aldrovandia affinis]|uniref:Uncharacterized protein n=1 Tax=Aldrovandia affinis TaxID=143900 RepID=A0AAD7S6R6_9TELE|nr:hypothetical protein AAFF_G00012770 [Aldrovandia affinis]